MIVHAGQFGFIQTGHKGKYSVGRQFIKFPGFLNVNSSAKYTSWGNRFTTIRKMMVDTGSTAKQEPELDALPVKDDDGGYSSGGWKR